MIAIDTNILVRLVTADDLVQHRQSLQVMSAPQVWVGRTVLLETAWVLAFSYQLSAATIADALRRVAGLPNVEIEDPTALARALTWYEGGLDFADALHLASVPDAERMVTFDKKFVHRAAGLQTHPRVALPDEEAPSE